MKMAQNNNINDLKGEIWKDVPNYEGLYQISNMGRVKSLNYRSHKHVVKILMPHKHTSGYLTIGLTKNGNKKSKQIHRLVYSAFIGGLPQYKRIGKGDDILEINHIDEDKTNNCIWNLELVTHTKNVNHGTGIERRSETQKNKRNSKLVYQYTQKGELVKIWPSTMECHRNGFEKGNVNACCSGKRNHCNGYIWSYKPLTIQECLEKKSKEHGEVYQFTLNGDLVNVWSNASECDKHGYNRICVRLCCLNKQQQHRGYIWSFNMLSKKEIEGIKEIISKSKKNKRKKVHQYTLNLELVKVWDSAYDCGKNGFCAQNIYACCRGKRKTYKGYLWSFEPIINNSTNK